MLTSYKIWYLLALIFAIFIYRKGNKNGRYIVLLVWCSNFSDNIQKYKRIASY